MKTRNRFVPLQFFLGALLSSAIVGLCHANPGPPIRLAIINEDSLAPASDLLTVELSKDSRLALLERQQIAKVLHEQALAVADGGNRDYLKVGELLGADGLLILTLAEKQDRQAASCRLVAVKPGVDLGLEDYDFPLSDPEQWSKLMARRFAPLLSKLTVLPKDAVPISILNLRSAVASSENEVLERQLTLLLHDRLMSERDLFVLERRRLETLTNEKEEKQLSESPFWNGSYLLEGTIDPRGFDSNRVTVTVQITPPDKKNVIALEVFGARSNLTPMINELASRITGSVSKGSVNVGWSATDEAERYFEEAKWMLRWGMSEEAKTASEAAWALGKQSREVAELRIAAYQACGGNPGICRLMDARVTFTRPPRAGLLGLNGYQAFAVVPDKGKLSACLRAADLWLDGLHLFAAPDNSFASSWYNLGITNLQQCSWWLRYFYFNAEARVGAEDELARARQLCREMSQSLAHQPERGQTEALWHAIAKHSAFWTETPEDTLRGYRELLDQGQWPALRMRFFNNGRQEAIAQAITTSMGHEASESADPCSPCLAGWDWPARQRCPELWNGFVDELCASSKPLIALEGLILRCSYSWSAAEYKRNLFHLQDFVRQQFESIAASGLDKKLAEDLQTLVNMRLDGLSSSVIEQMKKELWGNFKRDFDALQIKRRQWVETQSKRAAQQAGLETKERYLQTQTNFDFRSFADTLIHATYNAEEANQLLPVLTNYQKRILSSPADPDASPQAMKKAKAERQSAEEWIGVLERQLQAAISGPPVAASAPSAVRRPPAQPAGIAGGSPQPSPFPYPAVGNNPASMRNTQPALERARGSVKSVRFWKIPAGKDDDPQAAPRGQIVAACYRDGRLWVQALNGSFLMANSAGFYGVDLKTFDARGVEFHGEQLSFSEEMVVRKERRFDVDSNYLYLGLKDAVRRYSFQRQRWEEFAPAGNGRPQRLGNRMFFTTPNSILEGLPDGTLQLIASCRRRPPVNALDNMDNYAPCHLFLDPKGQINICASNELYVLSDANDCQHYATVPMKDCSGAELFDDGFLIERLNEWWGMFGPCRKPEFLFRQPYPMFGGPASPAATRAPRWLALPPARESCPDGDCLWFLVDSSRPMLGTPGSPSTAPGRSGALSLVRFKYGEPDSMRITVDLSQTKPNPRWTLAATPEGLIVTQRTTPGFWFIPRDELNQAVAQAYAQASAIKTEAQRASQPALP